MYYYSLNTSYFNKLHLFDNLPHKKAQMQLLWSSSFEKYWKKYQQFTFQHSPERMVLNSSEVSECDMLRSTVIPLYLSLVTESGLNEVWMSVWLFLHQLHTEGSRLRDPIAGSNLQKEKNTVLAGVYKVHIQLQYGKLYIYRYFHGMFFLMRMGKKRTIQMIIIVALKNKIFYICFHNDWFH